MGYGVTDIIGGTDALMARLLLEKLLLLVNSVAFLLPVLLGFAGYFLLALGLYTIAKRRGIRHAWFAWVPLLNRWTLGSISDQYQYVTARKVKNKRKWLLGLSFVPAILTVVGIVLMFVFFISILAYGYSGASGWDAYAWGGLGSLLACIGVSLAITAASIAIAVLQYIALYDLYKSCNSSDSVVFLLLSIFIPVCMPILVFLCRNKDLGMPPRKAITPPEERME